MSTTRPNSSKKNRKATFHNVKKMFLWFIVSPLFFALCFGNDINGVPVIEWGTYDVKFPCSARSIGVEIYNNIFYGIGGHNCDPIIYYTNIDEYQI